MPGDLLGLQIFGGIFGVLLLVCVIAGIDSARRSRQDLVAVYALNFIACLWQLLEIVGRYGK